MTSSYPSALKHRLIPAAVALLALAASAQKITVEADPAVDFHKYKTFAIREGSMRSPSAALNNELTKKRLEAAIEQALISRGLAKVNGPADLNVFYIFGSMRRTDTETRPGVRPNRVRTVRTSEIEGNLVIDLRDAATRGLVWHALATDEESDVDKLSRKIEDMVKKTLAKYPPKK